MHNITLKTLFDENSASPSTLVLARSLLDIQGSGIYYCLMKARFMISEDGTEFNVGAEIHNMNLLLEMWVDIEESGYQNFLWAQEQKLAELIKESEMDIHRGIMDVLCIYKDSTGKSLKEVLVIDVNRM